jgi:anti-sigma B factor antagonist
MTSSPHGAETLQTHTIGAVAAPLEIDTEPEPRGVRVRPRGEVDLGTVGHVRTTIEECVAAGYERVIVDLQGVTFLDSTGLRLMLEADAAARADGWKLLLIEGPAPVQRVFEVAGVRDSLPFVKAQPRSTPDDSRRPESARRG